MIRSLRRFSSSSSEREHIISSSSTSTSTSTMLSDSSDEKRILSRNAETWAEMIRIWPKCTILIVANEFIQKITDLGNVLTLYLMNVVGLSGSDTTLYSSLYLVCGGITPLIASILADGYIGKFNTILIATLTYCTGKLVMTMVTFFPHEHLMHPIGDIIGLALLVLGMGGIVANVASFSGDQFAPHETRMIAAFFSVYYATLNAGMIISALVMPIFRAIPCMGQSTCYPLSFGISAICMILASVIFFLGSKSYVKRKARGNIFADIYSTCKIALINRREYRYDQPKRHWLDYFLLTHDCQHSTKCLTLRKRTGCVICERALFLADVKALLRVIVMFLPVPMFFALYGQQYNVWLIQALSMDCAIWGDNFLLLPDQMQFVNPTFIIILIFLFESCVYPALRRYFIITPLRKMTAGGAFAALAFVVSAFLQLRIDSTLPAVPTNDEALISIMNTYNDCDLNVNVNFGGENLHTVVTRNTSLIDNGELRRHELLRVPIPNGQSLETQWHITALNSSTPKCPLNAFPIEADYKITGNSMYSGFVANGGMFLSSVNARKPTDGIGELRASFIVSFDTENLTESVALCKSPATVCRPSQHENFVLFDIAKASWQQLQDDKSTLTIFDSVIFRPGRWGVYYSSNDSYTPASVEFSMGRRGGVYVLSLTGSRNDPQKHVFQLAPDSSISILWQLPQKALMSVGEMLFLVTGFEFAYSQSGSSMKAVVQALWFLTGSIGNGIVMFVASFRNEHYAAQYFSFACAMLVFIIVFAWMSTRYTYRDNTHDRELLNVELRQE